MLTQATPEGIAQSKRILEAAGFTVLPDLTQPVRDTWQLIGVSPREVLLVAVLRERPVADLSLRCKDNRPSAKPRLRAITLARRIRAALSSVLALAKEVLQDRTFEDVIFGAILGAWSLKVERLWKVENWHLPFVFLSSAVLLALALRLLWRLGPSWDRVAWYLWVVGLIALVSGVGVWTTLFSSKEGLVFACVFVAWSATGMIGDLLSPLIPRRKG